MRWSNTLNNHKPITEQQIQDNLTPAMVQWGPHDKLEVADIFIWGSLAYGWIPLKDRAGKVSPRAEKAIWVGLDDETPGAHRLVPFVERTDEVDFLPTVKCMRARAYDGVFPLHSLGNGEIDTEGGDEAPEDVIDITHLLECEETDSDDELGTAAWLRRIQGKEEEPAAGKE